jgi:hypothetical protein
MGQGKWDSYFPHLCSVTQMDTLHIYVASYMRCCYFYAVVEVYQNLIRDNYVECTWSTKLLTLCSRDIGHVHKVNDSVAQTVMTVMTRAMRENDGEHENVDNHLVA